jgi:hypothetical protein
MKLLQNDNGKWYWEDNGATSQEFNLRENAKEMKRLEDAEREAEGLGEDAGAGWLEWNY